MWRRVLHGVGANAFTQIIIAIIQLLLVPTLITHWGLELYGWWILASAVPSYLMLGDLGLSTAAGADMTMHVARGDRLSAVVAFQNAWAAIAVLSSLVLIVGLSLIWTMPDQVIVPPNTVAPASARLTLSLLTLQAVISLQGGVFLAGFRCVGMYAFGTYSQALIFLAEGVALVLIGVLNETPATASLALVLCRAVGVGLQALLLCNRASWLKLGLGRASWSEVRRLLRPSAGAFALTAAQITFLQGTTLAVGAASSVSSAAIFSSIRTLTRIGIQLAGVVHKTLAPEYSVVSAQLDRTAQARIVAASLLTSLAVLLPTSLVLLVFGGQIVRIWTHGAIEASWTFLGLMTLAMVVHGLWLPVSNLLLAINRHEQFSYMYLLLSMSSVALAYLLASYGREMGGALAVLLLDCATAWMIYRTSKNLLATPQELLDVLGKDRQNIGNRIRLYFLSSR